MTGRVIQGFFVGGRMRASVPVERASAVQRATLRDAAARPAPGPPAPCFVRPGFARPGAPVQTKPAPGRPPLVQPARAVQRFAATDSVEIDPAMIGLARSGGKPLPQAVLAKMQAAFGADFSAVRVHIGPQAARIGAIAFTTGNDLYFAPGRYQPESIQGQQLIGHELAHVIQQRQGRVRAPGMGLAVVQDRALEAEADRLGMRAAAAAAAVQPKRHASAGAAGAPRTVQRYSVVGQDRIMAAEPSSRPWFGYPYAVVPKGTHFTAQQRKGGPTGVHEFLKGANTYENLMTANLSNRRLDDVTLRVSNDGKMAIEDSDLNQRQPKTFFATADVISAANNIHNGKSIVRLKQLGQTITIVTGWRTQHTLYRVIPEFSRQPAQNCDELAGQITGIGNGFSTQIQGGKVLSDAVARFLDTDPKTFDVGAHPGSYMRWQSSRPNRLRRLGLNLAATPEVGDAYAIGTVGTPIGYVGEQAQVLDIASNQIRTLNWGFHFAGVVARSGTDRVTLENYARGDGRKASADPRWYFQMYGETKGQTFHEFHEARKDYANPATVSTAKRSIPRQGPLWYPGGEQVPSII